MSISSKLKRVAIVGAGPAGLYTAKKLLGLFPSVRIKIYERESNPFGLLRYGVAPDHVKTKKAMDVLRCSVLECERVVLECNSEIGYDKHISVAQLRRDNQAVILANGALKDKSDEFLKLKNTFSGLTIARWYNGFAKASDEKINFNTNIKNIVIVGMGDVAMDVARIMLKDHSEYSCTDFCTKLMPAELRHNLFAAHSPFDKNTNHISQCSTRDCIDRKKNLSSLHRSSNPTVTVIGRRGFENAAFSVKLVRQLLNVSNISLSCVNLNQLDAALNYKRRVIRSYEIFQNALLSTGNTKKLLRFLFLHKPMELLADAEGCIRAIKCYDVQNNSINTIDADVAVFCFGQETVSILDKETSRKQVDECLRIQPGLYIVGWANRGSKGLIADTVIDAETVAQSIQTDLETKRIT